MDRAGPFAFVFDRRLLPTDVHRGSVTLVSGTRAAFLSPRFDPVDVVLFADLVGGALEPDVVYRMRVEGVRDLDGEPLAEPVVVTFETGSQAVGVPAPSVTYADVAPIFERSCATAGCHASAAPALGLDLSSGEGIRRSAIGVAAQQTRVGIQAEDAWVGTQSFEGMARVDVVGGVGSPSRSYLLYKALGDEHVRGERMPPPPLPALHRDELHQVADWIRVGAPTD